MKKKLFFAAVALVALASCTSDEFIGDVTTPQDNSPSASDAIVFSSASQGSTRANKYGADAADLLGNQFIVLGVKGDGTGVDQTTVFSNYVVSWTQNTAGKTQSNTSDWEYVGVTPISNITGVSSQSIKYWDYSATSYDFAAYSAGKGNAIVTTTPSTNQIQASSISYAKSDPAANAYYTLSGTRSDLAECYITDMVTVGHADFGQEVVLNFRSLATKVRMALYETVPGYSVANVKFYSEDQNRPITTTATSTDATLIGSAFYTGGTYTVSFPHIGSDDADPSATYHSDYNKAHVEMTTITSTDNTQAFGSLNYGSKEKDELPASSTSFLKRTSSDPSFADNGTYQTVLPKEDGTVLELCVDYTLVPIDGAEETITIYGAKAYVPAVYTKWLPNYAYTYIFKISDNTNGWTNPTGTDATDPAGLFPITFDAVVLDSEETGHQTTITTVAEPSITTYQKGHVYSETNSYSKDEKVYVQVMQDGALVGDLDEENKSYFFQITNAGINLTAKPSDWPTGYYTDPDCSTPAPDTFEADTYYKACTEAVVMDALNIRTSGNAATVEGRNGIILTPASASYDIEAIPGEDGNDITVTEGEAGELDTDGGDGIYAYVYDYTTGNPVADDIYTSVVLTSDDAPTDWVVGDNNIYYTYNPASSTYVKVTGSYAAGNYYKKYSDLNRTYAVKVIKFE